MNNNNDSVLILLELFANAQDKERAYRLTVGVEMLIANGQYDAETKIAVYNILATIYIWNNDYEKAKIAQHYFLSNIEWCEINETTSEDYLLLVFAKNNKRFIGDLVAGYPKVKSYFIDLYKAYLCMIDPEDEDNFDPNSFHYYNKFKKLKKLYQ